VRHLEGAAGQPRDRMLEAIETHVGDLVAAVRA
jgi:hypothetical protein